MLMRMQAVPPTNVAEFTVSELAFAIKRTVEDAFGLIRLRGEISGYRGPHSSGHAYLCLKDDRARIEAVIWRSTFSALKFKPEEGLEVIVTGRVTTFPGKSSYQIVIEQIEPAGIGALMALLEDRKKRFAAEGLFDEARKRPLPFWPLIVGVITSPTGAVIRDILHGFTERCPTRVLLWPVRVQGETCAAEVAAAIRGFNALTGDGPLPRPELLIVARGGGSLEDLWGFNEEIVVRAVAESAIPLISAVGHETDWTLVDFVADARAPTPTKAAEWAVPRHSELCIRLNECADRVRHCVRRHFERLRAEFRGAERGLPRPQALLGPPRQRADLAGERLRQSLHRFAERARGRLERMAVRLSPRLIGGAFEAAADRHARLSQALMRAYAQNFRKKGDRLADRALRLNPSLLAGPVSRHRERLQMAALRLSQAAANSVQRKSLEVRSLSQVLKSLSHQSVLERGFALVRSGGNIIHRAAMLEGPAALDIEFADGHVRALSGGGKASDAPVSSGRRSAAAASQGPAAATGNESKQGRLF